MQDLFDPWMHPFPTALVAAVIVILVGSIRMAQEYQRAVIFLLGRVVGARGPGLFLKLPFIERAVIVDLRTITSQLETQETVTSDGVPVKVNAVVWYHAVSPAKTIVAVLDWHEAVRQAVLTALRDTIGQSELDDLLKDRLNANLDLKRPLGVAVEKRGVEIAAVELKDLGIPENMQRAIAKEAEAIREKRARIIKADGELEAATKLNEAAAIIAPDPTALELRRLQALTEIGVEHNSVIIVSLPVENNATRMPTALAKSTAHINVAQHSEGAFSSGRSDQYKHRRSLLLHRTSRARTYLHGQLVSEAFRTQNARLELFGLCIAILAILLASASAATFVGRRANNLASQGPVLDTIARVLLRHEPDPGREISARPWHGPWWPKASATRTPSHSRRERHRAGLRHDVKVGKGNST